jgi:CBS domain-containing protein
MQVKDLMQPTTEVVHVDQSLLEAETRLRRFRLPALAVVDGDEIVGLLTARAVENEMTARGDKLAEAMVRDHMSTEVAFCRGDETAEVALGVMQEGGYSRLLVTDDAGRLCGTITLQRLAGRVRPQGDQRTAAPERHRVETSGRAGGGKLHRPESYSVKPIIKP